MKTNYEILHYFQNLGFELQFNMVNTENYPSNYKGIVNNKTIWITVKKETRPNNTESN